MLGKRIWEIFTGIVKRNPSPKVGHQATYRAIKETPGFLQRAGQLVSSLAKTEASKLIAIPLLAFAAGYLTYQAGSWYQARSNMQSALKQSRKNSNQLVDSRKQDQITSRENRKHATRSFGGYYPVVATLSNGKQIYSVRAGLGPVISSSLRHGGISGDKVPVRAIGKMCNTAAEATELLAKQIAPGSLKRPRLAGGYVATVGGKRCTVDDWGAVDFNVLRRLGK